MQEAEQSLGYYRGPPKAVLRAIDRAALSDAVLEIDAGEHDALYDFVEARTADRPALAEENRVARHGKFRIGWFKWGPFVSALPIAGDNLPELIALVEPPEILLWELNVRDDDGYLLQAPGVGDNEIWVSERLGAQAVHAIRDALGPGLRPPDAFA